MRAAVTVPGINLWTQAPKKSEIEIARNMACLSLMN